MSHQPENQEKCYKCTPEKFKIEPGGILPICKKHWEEKTHQPENQEKVLATPRKCEFMHCEIGWGGDCYCCAKCGLVYGIRQPENQEKIYQM